MVSPRCKLPPYSQNWTAVTPRHSLPAKASAWQRLIVLAHWDLDGETKQIASLLGEERFTPADKARDILKWKPRNASESIIETANQMTERNLA